jgi:hypothetical protein
MTSGLQGFLFQFCEVGGVGARKLPRKLLCVHQVKKSREKNEKQNIKARNKNET